MTQICIHPLVAPSSRLFRNFPKDLLRSLASENITANFHSWSLSMQVISASSFFSFLPVIGEVFCFIFFLKLLKCLLYTNLLMEVEQVARDLFCFFVFFLNSLISTIVLKSRNTWNTFENCSNCPKSYHLTWITQGNWILLQISGQVLMGGK